jgi:transcriptional regulator of acetoin/glycerol metabolism
LVFARSALCVCEQLVKSGPIEICGHEVINRNEPPEPVPGEFKAAMRDYKTAMVVASLKRNHGNCAAAARDLGLARSYVHRMLQRKDVQDALMPDRTD